MQYSVWTLVNIFLPEHRTEGKKKEKKIEGCWCTVTCLKILYLCVPCDSNWKQWTSYSLLPQSFWCLFSCQIILGVQFLPSCLIPQCHVIFDSLPTKVHYRITCCKHQSYCGFCVQLHRITTILSADNLQIAREIFQVKAHYFFWTSVCYAWFHLLTEMLYWLNNFCQCLQRWWF